jgi:hypothetical protein
VAATARLYWVAGARSRAGILIAFFRHCCQIIKLFLERPRFAFLGFVLLSGAHRRCQDIACVSLRTINCATHFERALFFYPLIKAIYLIHQILYMSFILLFFRLRQRNEGALRFSILWQGSRRQMVSWHYLRDPLITRNVIEHMIFKSINFLPLHLNNIIF